MRVGVSERTGRVSAAPQLSMQFVTNRCASERSPQQADGKIGQRRGIDSEQGFQFVPLASRRAASIRSDTSLQSRQQPALTHRRSMSTSEAQIHVTEARAGLADTRQTRATPRTSERAHRQRREGRTMGSVGWMSTALMVRACAAISTWARQASTHKSGNAEQMLNAGKHTRNQVKGEPADATWSNAREANGLAHAHTRHHAATHGESMNAAGALVPGCSSSRC